MSFKFNWRFFDVEDLQARCQEAFTESIASTRRPAVIAEPIRATRIDFGTKPPHIAFCSVPAVSLNKTHIVFALKYSGDASVTLETAIQANPLLEPFNDPQFPEWVKPRVVGALGGLVLPFRLKIKNIVLDTLIDVVYTPNGVAVVFHKEPVKSVEVESTLDMIPGVNSMISEMLKYNFMEAFEEDIPESVWASTNPKKQPPQPYFGARRWSQHLKTFAKFSTTMYQPLGPETAADLPAFATLALNTRTPQFALPHAIPNRAYLPGAKHKADHSIPRRELLEPRSLSPYLTEGSNASRTTASGSFTTSTSGSGHKFKPKRRVINLKSKLAPVPPSPPNEKNQPNGHKANQSGNEKSRTPSRSVSQSASRAVSQSTNPSSQPNGQSNQSSQSNQPSQSSQSNQSRQSSQSSQSSQLANQSAVQLSGQGKDKSNRTASRSVSQSVNQMASLSGNRSVSASQTVSQLVNHIASQTSNRIPSQTASQTVPKVASPSNQPASPLAQPNLTPKRSPHCTPNRTPSRTSDITPTGSPNRTPNRTPNLSSTPVLNAHRFLVRPDNVFDLPSYAESNESAIGEEPLLPSSLNWEHHRSFSSPEDIEVLRNVAASVKQRTISLPPSNSTPISRRSSSGQRLGLEDFQRSPGRYASTNDLIEKD